ncbi:MAG: DUF1489 domain-containing protein [Pseudomonadota bacterium]
MALHIVKLCVGVESVDDLRAFIAWRARQAQLAGYSDNQIHTTRMCPKRADEIVGQGSLYWVIKGSIQCRQKIIELNQFTDVDQTKRCDIVMSPELILTVPQPKRPFQGWRYLNASDAPADLPNNGAGSTEVDPKMAQELSDLGLL